MRTPLFVLSELRCRRRGWKAFKRFPDIKNDGYPFHFHCVRMKKSYVESLGIQIFIGLYLLCFSDFIIAQFFPFFNWHFSRSFQNIFVEQGELSATFRKCIYKKHFLWYNGNVGACEDFSVFRLWAPEKNSPPFFFLCEKSARVPGRTGIACAELRQSCLAQKKRAMPTESPNMKITLDYVLPQPSQGLFLVDLDI